MGNPCLIPNHRKADMEDFLEDLEILLGNLGFPFLQEYNQKDAKKNNNMNYFLQTKNPDNLVDFLGGLTTNFSICTTLETNIFYNRIMNDCPPPQDRALALSWAYDSKKYITSEPIRDFE